MAKCWCCGPPRLVPANKDLHDYLGGRVPEGAIVRVRATGMSFTFSGLWGDLATFDMLTVREAAEFLGMSKSTIRTMYNHGNIKGVTLPIVGLAIFKVSLSDMYNRLAKAVTVDQAAKMLRTTPGRIYQLTSDGSIKYETIAGRMWLRRQSVECAVRRKLDKIDIDMLIQWGYLRL